MARVIHLLFQLTDIFDIPKLKVFIAQLYSDFEDRFNDIKHKKYNWKFSYFPQITYNYIIIHLNAIEMII